MEGLLCLQHAGGGPPERHLDIAPALDVTAGLANGSKGVLDNVSAGQGVPEFVGEALPSISLLAVIAVLQDCQKIVLAVKKICGETGVAWRAVLEDLFAHGLL